MLKGIDLGETKEYIPRSERGSPNPTRFILGVLDACTLMELEDRATSFRYDPEKESVVTADFKWNVYQLDVVRFGLKGWKNFLDKNGQERPFRTRKLNRGNRLYEVPTDETLSQIPIKVIRELADVILNWNQLEEAEAKNSGLPSPSSNLS